MWAGACSIRAAGERALCFGLLPSRFGGRMSATGRKPASQSDTPAGRFGSASGHAPVRHLRPPWPGDLHPSPHHIRLRLDCAKRLSRVDQRRLDPAEPALAELLPIADGPKVPAAPRSDGSASRSRPSTPRPPLRRWPRPTAASRWRCFASRTSTGRRASIAFGPVQASCTWRWLVCLTCLPAWPRRSSREGSSAFRSSTGGASARRAPGASPIWMNWRSPSCCAQYRRWCDWTPG
jgi:hypothetical protein